MSTRLNLLQGIWISENTIVYSKNDADDGTFNYGKGLTFAPSLRDALVLTLHTTDVHTGIYSLFQRNLTTGSTKKLVSSYPGGASRPEISRDGRTLAFVRRVRDKEALVLLYVGVTCPIRATPHNVSGISRAELTLTSGTASPTTSQPSMLRWERIRRFHSRLTTRLS